MKHVSVPGRIFPVKEHYLENILVDIGYSTPQMEAIKRDGGAKSSKNRRDDLAELAKGLSLKVRPDVEDIAQAGDDVVIEKAELSDDLKEQMDDAIAKAFLNADKDAFDLMLNLILNETVPIDYQVSINEIF